MSSRDLPPTATTRNRLRRFSNPTGSLLAPFVWLERARGRKRYVLALAYLLVLAVVGLLSWRAASLSGLPDVGDPFDVAAFGTVVIPDDENAFIFYGQATARFKPPQGELVGPAPTNVSDWAQADPALRRWVEENHEALELWRRGAARPRAVLIQPRKLTIQTPLEVAQQLREFTRMALLEASRREHAGDVAGAWELYSAALRSSRHVGMSGGLVQRLIGVAMLRSTIPRVVAWSADPRVDTELLRQAVTEVHTCEAMTPPVSEALKVEYLMLMHELGRWPDGVDQVGDRSAWYQHLPLWTETGLWLKREPERSRRVTRLVFANWLTYCDRPPDQRPGLCRGLDLPLYQVDPTATQAARGLAPEVLDGWARSAPLAAFLLPAYRAAPGAISGESAQLRSLRVELATRRYAREHGGVLPLRMGDLVGRYLDALPEGYADDDGPSTLTEPQAATNEQP